MVWHVDEQELEPQNWGVQLQSILIVAIYV